MYSSVPSPPSQWNPGPSLERSTTAVSPLPSPTSTTSRSGRLRGLSYLRSYTQNHILSRDHSSSNNQPRPSTLARAITSPSPSSSPGQSAAPTSSTATRNLHPQQASPAVQRATIDLPSARASSIENIGSTSTSVWLPTVGGQSGVTRTATVPQAATASPSTALSANGVANNITPTMARTRSATVGDATVIPQVDGRGDSNPQNEAFAQANETGERKGMAHQLPSIRFSAHQDPRAQRSSLVFSSMSRILPTGKEIIKVGRYSERDNPAIQAASAPSSAPVGFKSKVVSRRHCEFWYSGGRWYIKDVKSSSGTFLNHIRLSSPGTESRPFPVNDGDIVQLGIDFKGGEEMIFRCVKIRVELNKGWQTGPTSFNVQSHKRLRELNNLGKPAASGTDCSICLGPIAPCQSLSVADLEAELDDPVANGEWEEFADTDDSVQPPEPVAPEQPTNTASQTTRQQNSSDNSAVLTVVARGSEQNEPVQDVFSDIDLADVSDDSRASESVQQAADQLCYLHMDIDEPSPPSSSGGPQPNETSNSTVAPVDIVSRKSVAGLAAGSETRLERGVTRTPSPNGLPASLADALTGVEGPMTPRNDAGPFVFDGSAGRASDMGPVVLATMNLNAAADSPTSQATPQPTS